MERTPQQGADDLNALLASAVNVVEGTIATGVNPGSSVTFRYQNPISGETLTATGIALTPCPPTRITALRTEVGEWFVVGASFARQVREVVLTARHGRQQPETTGKLKLCYKATSSSLDQSFWIGGWSRKAVDITAKLGIPADAPAVYTLREAYVDNLGGNRYAIDCSFPLSVTAGRYTYRRKRIGQNEWSADTLGQGARNNAIEISHPGSDLSYRGHGYWQTSLQAGQLRSDSTTTQSFYTACQSIDLFDGIQQTQTFDYSGDRRDPLQTSYSNAWSAELFPGVVVPQSDNSLRISDTEPGHYSVVDREGYTVIAANLALGVGFAYRYSITLDSRTNNPGTRTLTLLKLHDGALIDLSPTIAPTLLSLRTSIRHPTAVLSLRESETAEEFADFFFDVDNRGNLRAVERSALYGLASGDRKVDCLVYDRDTLEYRRTEKVKVFKPTNFTGDSVILNVSYHT